jgi:hypothetical protein
MFALRCTNLLKEDYDPGGFMSHDLLELLRQQEGEAPAPALTVRRDPSRVETGAQLRDVLREPVVVEAR